MAKSQILASADPRIAASTGKNVQMPQNKIEEWRKFTASPIMKKAMLAKFKQDPKARDTLIATGDNLLLEASRDKHWGIGRAIADPYVFSKDFPGKNVCGKLLMEVRALLLEHK